MQVDFYNSFKAAHADLKVSFVSFWKLRPFFVRRLRDFNSYCCRYHQEMIEITQAFNNMHAPKFHLQDGAQTRDYAVQPYVACLLMVVHYQGWFVVKVSSFGSPYCVRSMMVPSGMISLEHQIR